MHATLYDTVVHKMSCRGGTKQINAQWSSHNGCSSVLSDFIYVSYIWLFVCAVEISGVSGCQMAEFYWKFCYGLFVSEGINIVV